MLIIILVAVLVIGAIAGNIYTIRKDREDRKAKVDPITQHVEELAPESTPAPVAVEAITVKETPKVKTPKNAPKQKPLAKMEAKLKAKAKKSNA
jgi:hypothetical protein